MEDNLKNYVESIGLIGPLLSKVQTIYDFYTTFIEIEVSDIFVSEFINSDGSRVYENLWVFNNQFCGEATSFITSDDYDVLSFRNSVTYFRLTKKDYDIISNQTNDNSRLTLEVGLPDNRAGSLKASKENCKQLSFIFKKYILPNLKVNH